jgi:Ran GTPase-activating protein (RanGAP) involved in mRNA processing and transport
MIGKSMIARLILKQTTSFNDAVFFNAFKNIDMLATGLDLSDRSLTYYKGDQLNAILSLYLAHHSSIHLLKLHFSYLGLNTLEKIKALFNIIPYHIDTLNLSQNRFQEKTPADIITIFSSLPAHIRSLNLRGNFLGTKSAEDFSRIVSQLPTFLTELDLSDNQLGQKNPQDIQTIFKQLPLSITTLSAANNFTADNLLTFQAFLLALPSSVSTLDLSCNFNDQSVEAIQSLLSLIPSSIVSLNLADNFAHLAIDELIAVLSQLPPTIKILNLESALLNMTDINALNSLLKILPQHLKVIDLSDNIAKLFDYMPPNICLGNMFLSLSPKINTLSISHNQLGSQNELKIAEMLQGLSTNIKSIDLSSNELTKYYHSKTLHRLFSTMPNHITTVNLSDNDFNALLTDKSAVIDTTDYDGNWRDFIKRCPRDMQILDLSDYSRADFDHEDAINILKACPPSLLSIDLSDNELGSLPSDDLLNLVLSISRNVTSLTLKNNQLYQQSAKHLIEVFVNLPESITYLNLSHNQLSRYPEQEIYEIVHTIPAHIKTLNLTGNEFEYLNNNLFNEICKILSREKKIILHFNDYHYYHPLQREALAEAFDGFSANVIAVNLAENHLNDEMLSFLAETCYEKKNTLLGTHLLSQMMNRSLALILLTQFILKYCPDDVSLSLDHTALYDHEKVELALALHKAEKTSLAISILAQIPSEDHIPIIQQLLDKLPTELISLCLDHHHLSDSALCKLSQYCYEKNRLALSIGFFALIHDIEIKKALSIDIFSYIYTHIIDNKSLTRLKILYDYLLPACIQLEIFKREKDHRLIWTEYSLNQTQIIYSLLYAALNIFISVASLYALNLKHQILLQCFFLTESLKILQNPHTMNTGRCFSAGDNSCTDIVAYLIKNEKEILQAMDEALQNSGRQDYYLKVLADYPEDIQLIYRDYLIPLLRTLQYQLSKKFYDKEELSPIKIDSALSLSPIKRSRLAISSPKKSMLKKITASPNHRIFQDSINSRQSTIDDIENQINHQISPTQTSISDQCMREKQIFSPHHSIKKEIKKRHYLSILFCHENIETLDEDAQTIVNRP